MQFFRNAKVTRTNFVSSAVDGIQELSITYDVITINAESILILYLLFYLLNHIVESMIEFTFGYFLNKFQPQ